jgi:DNA-binding MarR family transcriptional regulator
MVKCPRCENEGKAVGKEWNYSRYHVKVFICKKCKKGFRAYFLNGKLSHTIPKLVSPTSKIIDYLRLHGEATETELASALRLSVVDVINTLKKLEKEGKVYPTPIS